MNTYQLTDEVDAVVIGTGAGGAPVLARLAKAGLKVVALEAGPWHDPQKDFATDERAQSYLFWNEERLIAGKNPVAFGYNNSGTGVGGTTLHYTAYTPRPQPDDLKLHTEFGASRDWPLEFEELEPYLEEVEAFLGISGPTPYPWGPTRRKGYSLPPLPLNGAAQLMARGCDALGIKHSPAANAALSGQHFQEGVGWRQPCTNRGFCQMGCSVSAKGSMDATYVPYAVHYGAEVRPDCFVTKIETQNGRVTGVVYEHEGAQHRQACKALFLCAGPVETPRLLMLNELCLDSGQVGRNFMAHPGIQVWGQFEDDVRPWKGIPGGLISEDTHRVQGADFVGGYLLQSIGVMPVTYVGQLARGEKRRGGALWGQELRDHMRGYNHTAGINILGEGLPSKTNYMELSEEKDARGLSKPRIYHSRTDSEENMTRHAEKLMLDIWGAAGAMTMWSFDRSAHGMGTCVMGHDPADSVVNPYGQSHEIANLYIADISVFPSSLSVNPALTMMSLALRSADNFLGA